MHPQEQGSIHVSVVSHGQGKLVAQLLEDFNRFSRDVSLHVTVTLNIPERLDFNPAQFHFAIDLLHNAHPRGFSENHNAAFRHGAQFHYDWFCVVNPDIRISENIFPALLAVFAEMPGTGLVAPTVCNQRGTVEDSARRFPGIITPFLRVLGFKMGLDYAGMKIRFEPDWVAGMFMLFPASTYKALGGFDDRFFLYYEDVDLCARLRLAGYGIVVEPKATVIHESRRDSHRKLKYLQWHLRSALRFFSSSVYWRVMKKISN